MNLTSVPSFSHVTPPITTGNVTAGRVYRVLQFSVGESPKVGWGFKILDDKGDSLICVQRRCLSIGDRDWIAVSFEENLKKILEE